MIQRGKPWAIALPPPKGEIPEAWFESLPTRTKLMWKSSHVLLADGVYTCLDLNVSGRSYEEMNDAAWEASRALAWDGILPAAPRALWERFGHGSQLEVRRLDVECRKGYMIAPIRQG